MNLQVDEYAPVGPVLPIGKVAASQEVLQPLRDIDPGLNLGDVVHSLELLETAGVLSSLHGIAYVVNHDYGFPVFVSNDKDVSIVEARKNPYGKMEKWVKGTLEQRLEWENDYTET